MLGWIILKLFNAFIALQGACERFTHYNWAFKRKVDDFGISIKSMQLCRRCFLRQQDKLG